jgi:hypothetical protein
MHDDQTLLAGNGAVGQRLGDSLLLPAPLRKFAREGERVMPITWTPGLPELIGAARGRAH